MIKSLSVQPPVPFFHQHLKGTVVRLSILLATLVAMAACGDGKETTLERLVPSGSTLIASIQVDKALEDHDLDGLFQDIQKGDEYPQTIADVVAKAAKGLGVDLSQTQQVVFFADLSKVEEPLALIAKGSFHQKAVVATVEKELGISLGAVEYKGHTLLERDAEDGGDQVALTVLEQETLVLGTPEAVRSVIDVREGDLDPASGQVFEAFQALGNRLVRAALAPPPETAETLGDLPLDIPLNLDFLTDLQILAISVDKDGDGLKSEVRLDFSSESTAKDAGEVVDALFTLADTLVEDEGLQELVDKAEVSVSGRRVKIAFQADVSELSEVAKDLSRRPAGPIRVIAVGSQQNPMVPQGLPSGMPAKDRLQRDHRSPVAAVQSPCPCFSKICCSLSRIRFRSNLAKEPNTWKIRFPPAVATDSLTPV